MRASARNCENRPCPAGFTLIEMLVALAVAMLLLVLIASITSSSLSLNTLIHGRLLAQQDTKVALDFLERDLDALAPAEKGRTTLTLAHEVVAGPGGANEISSFWIMLLSRPTSSSYPGQIRAVSYRLLLLDPMVPGGSNKRLALYRTELPRTLSGNATAFLDVADLHAGFWKDYWATHAADNGGKTLLDDYLVENIVDTKVTLNYLAPDGTLTSLGLLAGAAVSWTSNGFDGALLATPNTPVSITLTLTSLRPAGVKLYESGAMTLDTAIRQQGVSLSRTFPINPSRLH
ncbi:MAG: prepilin-type N-terminal cleavage/methylation domain-containing protein [Verrucomicrobia bacterium]|nr:prepilin-type N-terminal cleavage/methylation domain-containing protein [Verrucomicrobiota bacterium]